jgi:4,5:9,10-diseco-3-hydroxy-5,9,17-trioxoandrosta-1(10),2-diene-4-oate hydrolase
MREAIVERDGYRIRVVTRGPENGPHAVILPGMGATAFALAPQIRLLQRLGYTTHTIDLPGFGLPPALRKEDARFSQLADLVIATCDALGIERALILGHSLGGGIALHVALARRALVAGLVLLAPAALGRSLVWTYKLFCVPLIGRALLRPYSHGTREYLRHFLLGSERRDDAKFVDRMLRHDSQSPAKARSMRAIVWANQPSRWRRIGLFLSPGGEQTGFTLRDRVAAFRDIPTLLLWGNEDRVISAHDAAAFRAMNPDAEVHIARGIAHMLPLEAPEWTNEHIAWFDALRLRPTIAARAA